jgi:hypothetical protein
MKSRLARFYSWSPEVINDLDMQEALEYFNCIARLTAEETLRDLKVEDWHQLKDRERTKFWNSLKSEAFPVKESSKQMSNEELDAWLRGVLGG